MASKLDKLVKKNESQFCDTVYLANRSAMFHTCCKCKSRHVFFFKICETETGEKFIELDIYGDELGSELRRFYEREKNKKRKA